MRRSAWGVLDVRMVAMSVRKEQELRLAGQFFFFLLVNWIYAIFGWVVRIRFVCAASARIGMASLCVRFFCPKAQIFFAA